MEDFPNATKPEPVLQVRSFVKSFPGVKALDKVNFELRRGEIHALVGENGAGKSTLIHVLGGVYQAESGAVLLNGKHVNFASPHAAARKGIGVVFQENSLCPNLSVAENIFAHRQALKVRFLNLIDWAGLNEQTKDLLQLFKLEVHPQTPVKHLSPAHKQVVEILKALSTRPSILILDEPTSSLTDAETRLLFNNMRRLASKDVSTVYISHHLPEVFEIADRVTVLRDGKDVHTCPVSEITERKLGNRMVGRELKDMYGRPLSRPGVECFRLEHGEKKECFRDITFSVRKGEIVTMAGLAGSGRTEIARCIFGVTPFDTGSLYLQGEKITARNPAEAISRRIGYLTEDRKLDGLFLDMTVRENCAAPSLGSFTRKNGIIDDKAISRFTGSCIRNFRIVTPSLAQKVVNLSGGNQQKVLLAMWMGIAPKFLIVDEPTRGVDVGARAEIYLRLRELSGSGIGILMISSDLPEVLGLSDRILVIRNGELVKEFASGEATEQNIIAYATALDE